MLQNVMQRNTSMGGGKIAGREWLDKVFGEQFGIVLIAICKIDSRNQQIPCRRGAVRCIAAGLRSSRRWIVFQCFCNKKVSQSGRLCLHRCDGI